MTRRLLLFITAVLSVCAACTDGNLMRRELALLEQRNLADSLLTDSVLAQRLADYFDSHGSQAERLEAHYLLARTWADLGQAPRALDAYHTAAEQADTTRLDSLSCHFLSRIYGQMGGLFDSQIIPWDAIKAINKASYYSLQEKDSFAAIIYEEQKIRAYYDMQCYDSVLTISERVMAGYQHYGATSHLVYPLASRIFAFLRLECYDSVASILNDYKLLARSENKEDGYFHSLLAQYFQATGDVDSALTHYRLTLLHCANNAEKAVPYRGLFQIYYQLGLVDSVAKYSQLYCNTTDSSVIFNSNATMQRMQHLYDYSHFQTIADRKAIEAGQANRRALMLAIALLLFVAIVYNWLVRYRAHVKLIRQQMNARYVSTLLAYNTVKSELQRETQQNIAWRKQAETELEQLRAALTEAQNDGHIPEQWDIDDKLFRSPVLVQSHQAAIQGRRMPDNIWMELRRLVNREMPGFMEKLSAFAYKPDMTETQIIILLRLRFILSEISVLLDIKSSNLSAKRRRLLKKMFGIDGSASQFDTKIRQL